MRINAEKVNFCANLLDISEILRSMKPSEKRSLIFLIIIILIIFTIMVFFAALLPLIKQSLSLNEILEQKRQEFDIQNQNLAQVTSSLFEYRSATAENELVTLILPFKEEIPQIINQIVESTKNNFLVYEGINFSPGGFLNIATSSLRDGGAFGQFALQLTKSYSYVVVNIDVSGKYSDIKQWIKFLESNMRLMDIMEISLSSALQNKEADIGNPLLKAKVLLNVYYQPK